MAASRTTRFREEREAGWKRLAKLVEQIERQGVRSLSEEQAIALPGLYRGALSSLSVARSISLDSSVRRYLESLTLRAYYCIYGPKESFIQALARFVRADFPVAVRRSLGPVALSALAMILGTVIGWWLTATEPEWFYSFVGAELAGDRGPGSSRESLRKVLYDESGGGLTGFATFLLSHNTAVGILSFALGFALGVPSLVLMFSNGLMLGAFAAIHERVGLALDFWAWVLPHGVPELSAIVLCGGAGVAMGRALLVPGPHGRLSRLALEGRDVGRIVVGSVVLFVIAGLIEGYFRQLVTDRTTRLVVAGVNAVLLATWLGVAGRSRRAPERASA